MAELVERVSHGLAGRYAVERELGRGGSAVVFLADDLKHRRRVAIKVLLPELAAVLGTERFLREIEIASNLTHPHILPLHDSGEVDGLPYFVMPYIEGETLRDRLARDRQLPIPEALRLARQTADALGYAHGQGVVHRDIKPDNILLAEGHAVIADFGIARAIAVAQTHDAPQSGLATGTPLYMSPEQADGRSAVDARSDLFSLGCVLYEMLAGEPPWPGSDPLALAALRLNQAPKRLGAARPGVPAEVETAVRRLLAPRPDDRPRSAEEFLTSWAMPEREEAVARRKARRRWLAVRGAIATALGTAAVVIVGASPAELDARKVVVFPFAVAGDTAGHPALGDRLATMLLVSLDHTRWLSGKDPWPRVDPARAHRTAREESARWVVLGRVLLDAASVRLVLDVHDLVADSSFTLSSTWPRGTPDDTIGLSAAGLLLPTLIPPGRSVSPLELGHRPSAAVAAWLLGEQAYRRARFAEAQRHFEDALDADSTFAGAALRAALSAGWRLRYDTAATLVRDALRNGDQLTATDRRFAEGLAAYYAWHADSATTAFRLVLKQDPTWTDARIALGELYTHLLPSEAPLDTLAALHLRLAYQQDPGLSEPLLHLTEHAARLGRSAEAERYVSRLRASGADSGIVTRARLLADCARGRLSARRWREVAQRDVDAARDVARALTVAGLRQPLCALDGWRAVLAVDTGLTNYGSVLGLHAVLAGLGRLAEAESLATYAPTLLRNYRQWLLLLDAIAASRPGRWTAVVFDSARVQWRSRPDSVRMASLWALGIWEARTGRLVEAQRIADSLAARAAWLADGAYALAAGSVGAHVALARGDTTRALAVLDSLRPMASKQDLIWRPWTSLPADRLVAARIHLERREWDRARRTAEDFDAPAPVVYAALVPASLEIRRRAAAATGGATAARAYETRLYALTRSAR